VPSKSINNIEESEVNLRHFYPWIQI